MSKEKIIKDFKMKSVKNLSPLKTKEGWYFGVYNNHHEFRECLDSIESYFSSNLGSVDESKAKSAVKRLAEYFNLEVKEKNENICCDDNSETS